MARYRAGAAARSSGDRQALREDIASPSRSRTVFEPITRTPRSRSAAIRLTTRNCWKSFSPNTATSGRTCVNSLPTTVVTPPKKCGRKRSSSPTTAGPSVRILVAKPSGYMVFTSGFQIRSTPSAASLATSAFQVRGYELKSSDGANWAGLTKIETMTLSARRFASRTSDTWPSWRAPMVGTSAVVAFFARRLSTARRNAGTERTIMGLRDIWVRSLGVSEAAGAGLGAGRPTLSRPTTCRQAGRNADETSLVEMNARQLITDTVEQSMRFMIKADDRQFKIVIA